MKITNTLAALALAAAFTTPSMADDDGRQARCSNASLQGAYAFSAKGVTLAGTPLPPPFIGPFASGGTATFDGRGRFVLTATSSFNGIQQPASVRGTYSVNPDCTYVSQAENGVTFRSVIVDEGQEILILQTTPGVVITGIAKRLALGRDNNRDSRPQRCSTDMINSTYGFIAEGTAGQPTLPTPSGPLAGVGTVSFNRNGTFLLTAVRSVNGVLDPQPLPLQGTYVFNSNDCTFRMLFQVGFTFNAAVAAGGREIVFIETDPGTALVVTAKRI